MSTAVDERTQVTIGAVCAEESRLRRIEDDWDPLAVEEGRW